MPHLRRPALSGEHPVHVTHRVRPGVGRLRTQRRARVVQQALAQCSLHAVHWSIEGDRLHLIVEARGRLSLARAVQALAIRIARRLNALVRRTGSVFVDRYAAAALETRRAVAAALRLITGERPHVAYALPPRTVLLRTTKLPEGPDP